MDLSESESSDSVDNAPQAVAPSTFSPKQQSFWRHNYPEYWPALSQAICRFQYGLLLDQPFGEGEALQVNAISALQDTFQTFEQFPILYGMREMVCTSSLADVTITNAVKIRLLARLTPFASTSKHRR